MKVFTKVNISNLYMLGSTSLFFNENIVIISTSRLFKMALLFLVSLVFAVNGHAKGNVIHFDGGGDRVKVTDNAAPNTPIAGLNVQSNFYPGTVSVGASGTSTGTYSNMQPFLGMNYVIVTLGIYPIRP